MHRSYSQLNQLRKCGHQYKLERVEHKLRRPSTPAVAGKIVHKATEEIDRQLDDDPAVYPDQLLRGGLEAAELHAPEMIAEDSKHFPPDQWKRYGRKTLEKPNAEDINWFLAEGIPNAIRAYVDWRLAYLELFKLAEIPGFGPAIEVPFNYYLPNGQLVHGWIDRVFTNEVSGGYYPVDLKSGRKPDTDEQLGLYGAALKKALGWDVRWGYYLYGLKTGEAKLTPPLDIAHWTDAKLASIYMPAAELIERQLFIPQPGENCFHCGVSQHCEYVQSAL